MENGGNKALVEYEYQWVVDKDILNLLLALQEDFRKIKAWASQELTSRGMEFFIHPRSLWLQVLFAEPEEYEGRATAELGLYDDGWRVVKAKARE
jgi:hypothetical protein